MYIVGYIDDNSKTFENYTFGLSNYDIELLCTNEKMSKVEIVNWILRNRIEAVMIDYKLIPKFGFYGTELIAYLNEKLPGLQCMILTSFKPSSLNEKLVPEVLTLDRSIFNELDLSDIANKLIENCQVFKNRIRLMIERYETLLEKKASKSIDAMEMEEFADIYKVLRAYGEVDDLPLKLLDDGIDEKLDNLLEKLDQVLKDE